ncbi:MAG: pectin esterase, partial [Prevotella sp.]|nr:pectin esterase [Prevotella sp.]
IVGQSMEKTIIKNAPPKEQEGISSTATLVNTASELYLQDLTLRNAMTFTGATGRGVALQDKGNKTICKNISLESYQDTYYSNNNNAYNYFEGGEIHGVVDYVCGGGDVYFNKVKFVNEAIKDATIAAPNGAKKYGYVMNNCTIETLCKQFNFGRSWGPYSGLAWLNTTINQPSKLISTRFLEAGMNSAADKFVEYNSMDTNGNCISPASNILNFTHSTGNKQYETILTAAEAAEYSLDKVFPDWNPAEQAAQVVIANAPTISDNILSWDAINGATAYAIFKDNVIQAIVPASTTTYDISDTDASAVWTLRAANSRGGFGEPVEAVQGSTSIVNAQQSTVNSQQSTYNLNGQQVAANYKGIVVKKGIKTIRK